MVSESVVSKIAQSGQEEQTMKPRRRVGLHSPSRRRIQSLDIMTSCSSLLIQTTKNLSVYPSFQMENLCKIKLAFAVEEADVYSFGIVALEIVSGRSNTTYRPKEECIYRLDWALIKREGEFDGSSRPEIGLRLQQGRDHGDDQHSSPVHKRLSNSQASYAISCEHA